MRPPVARGGFPALGLVLVMMLMLVALPMARGWTQKNKWDKMDYDALEKAWEEGDDEELVMTDFEMKRKQQEEAKKNAPPFDPSDIASVMAARNRQQQGPVMMFCDLIEKALDGKDWNRGSTDLLTIKYKEMLGSGGVKVQVYNLDEGKLLFTAESHSDAFETQQFLLEQPEVDSVTLDSKQTFRKGREKKSPAAPRPPPPPPTKKATKKKKKKAAGIGDVAAGVGKVTAEF